ncbi:hypothetical protein TSH100_08345 [Azospirillum sp. TSH100]|uniref:lasso peptide biosynthesis B2 protein n=1 Tax=Azospirillum sp. TSH100 TaxID=652764 RepID=UPI000D60860F|nr:lasso peptide biosynthesis B2 protein [Azospirillum sp. TSH100]PWC88088.1 hypothetical protein TSH100_08345 [Azospirillum sp. TSH100]QCG92172.1 lasso peptide biosynthesis B2 protein [Azospirillum sp. TSH100]
MKQRLLRLEALLALLLAWGLVFLLPLRLTRRLLGGMELPGAGASSATAPVLARARGACIRLERVAACLPWHSSCLVQAVAGILLLRRRGIAGATIRFGVRKTDMALEAHAWLLLNDAILLGGGEAGSFSPLADLSRRG